MLGWNSSKISVIVVTEHKSYTFEFRVIHKPLSVLVAVEVWLNLFVKGKHTRNLVQILVYIFADKAVLGFKYVAQEVDIICKRCILHDGGVCFAAHSHGDYIFKLAVAFKSVFPELSNSVAVFPEVPGVSIN